MGDHTRVSWPLDFDPRIAAPSDEARSAAVEALRLKRDVYSGRLELNGEEHEKTLLVANN